MVHAIRIHQNGGPEVMRFEEVDIPPPGGGEVRLRHSAIGINFSDVNVRRGGFYFCKETIVDASHVSRVCFKSCIELIRI